MTIHSNDLRNAADPHSAVVAARNTLPIAAGGGETAIAAMAAKAQALVQARYEVAFHRPRDFDVVRAKLLHECRRPSFAEVAEYNKPVGKGIKGPSIRFAETAIRCMTNIVIETTTVYDDAQKRIVNVSVTDLESNVPYAQDVTIEKSVERNSKKDDDIVLRVRTGSTGKTVYIIVATDDDILNKQNALISKAIRTQGLRLVPGDLIDEAMDAVHKTLKNTDAQDPDAAKRKILDGFEQLGVGADQIKLYLGHDGSTLNPKELQTLRALYTALRDNETTWREIMDNRVPPDPKRPEQPGDHAKNAAPAQRGKVQEEQQPSDGKARQDANLQAHDDAQRAQARDEAEHVREAQAARAGRDPDAPPQEQKKTVAEEFSGAGDGTITFAEIVKAIGEAKTPKEVTEYIEPMIPEIKNDRHRQTLTNMANSKKQSLQEATQPKEETTTDARINKPASPASVPNTGRPATRRNVTMD